MKAFVYTRYGSPEVLELKEVPQPKPKENEVLIKVYSAAVNASDWRLLRGIPFLVRLKQGLFKPKVHIIGSDVAGRVEAVGQNVTQFEVGDEVYGDLSSNQHGAFAEYVCAPEQFLAPKPVNLSFDGKRQLAPTLFTFSSAIS